MSASQDKEPIDSALWTGRYPRPRREVQTFMVVVSYAKDVTPPGLIRPDEVPDWAGLLEPYVSEDDYCSKLLRQAVPAPLRSKDAPSWPLVVSMLRRETIMYSNEQSHDKT